MVLGNKLAAQYSIMNGATTIGCDCQQGAITSAVKRAFWISTKWSNFDLLKRIQGKIRESNIKFEFYKVKAHQDEVKSVEELDRWERTNTKADFLAKQLLPLFFINGEPCIPTPINSKTGWMIKINNEVVTTNIRARIKNHIWAFQGKQFWIHRLQLSPGQVQYVWWEVLEYISKILHP